MTNVALKNTNSVTAPPRLQPITAVRADSDHLPVSRSIDCEAKVSNLRATSSNCARDLFTPCSFLTLFLSAAACAFGWSVYVAQSRFLSAQRSLLASKSSSDEVVASCAIWRLPILPSRSNTGNTFLIHSALNTGHAKVLVLGGSLSAGHGAGGKANAWPALLEAENCTGMASLVNKAKPSTGSNYALANLHDLVKPLNWDIILLEYALNDDDVGEGSRYSTAGEVSVIFERLIRSIRTILPSTAVVVIEAFRQSKGLHMGFLSGQNYHDIVSKYYELPVISIREALWHSYFELKEKSQLWQAFPSGKSHPSREGQRLIADIIAREMMSFRSKPPILTRDRPRLPPLLLSKREVLEDEQAIRDKWRASYEFEPENTSEVLSQPGLLTEMSHGWKHVLQETRYGDTKPGMLCNSTFPNALRVDISACESIVQIGYLKTYERFGGAMVNVSVVTPLESLQKSIVLASIDSRWDQSRGSATHTDTFELGKVIQQLPSKSGTQVILSIFLEKETNVNDRKLFKVMYVRCR